MRFSWLWAFTWAYIYLFFNERCVHVWLRHDVRKLKPFHTHLAKNDDGLTCTHHIFAFLRQGNSPASLQHCVTSTRCTPGALDRDRGVVVCICGPAVYRALASVSVLLGNISLSWWCRNSGRWYALCWQLSSSIGYTASIPLHWIAVNTRLSWPAKHKL